MSRITEYFQNSRQTQHKTFVAFITSGDPRLASTVPMMHALVDSGADIIELGVPFSDPVADGPVIQAAGERALKHNTSLNDVINLVVEFRKTNTTTPIILMGYLNPIEVMGYKNFAEHAANAGVDGVITVDMPPEESAELASELQQRAIDNIFLLAPTSTPERIQLICEQATGFVYYVALKGVTGSGELDTVEVAERIALVRQYTDLPLGVGFGIHDAESAAQIASVSDAVVVGSAIVGRIAEHPNDDKAAIASVSHFVADLRQAIDTVNTGK